jgi:predicted negative regulator of RcsB-dependent stress response
LTDYLTEQEQIELLKNWIKQYSLVILAGVVLAMLAISGWRYWQQRQNKILTHASAIYNEMLTMRSQNNVAATLTQAKKLLSRYPQTTYAQLAALMLTKNASFTKDYPEAEKHLNLVITGSNISSLRQIARLRLAKIFIAQNKAEDALQQLKTVDDKRFIGLIDEVRGDAYLAMQNTHNARQAYQKALEELPDADVLSPVLRMKYDNLTTTIQPVA